MLKHHCVATVADVRSAPYSRFSPQFNREPLATELRSSGIGYLFLGLELGARRSEPEAYSGPTARYDLIEMLPAYQEGLHKLREQSNTGRIALMCAERDPLTCHRAILIGRSLREEFAISHILEDSRLESMEAAEARLLDLTGVPSSDLFRTPEELLDEAYGRQAARIAYTESGEGAEVRVTAP